MRYIFGLMVVLLSNVYAIFFYLHSPWIAYAQTTTSQTQSTPTPIQQAGQVPVRITTAQTTAQDWWWLVFQDHLYGNGEIYRARPDGRELKRLTFQVANDTQPRLAPVANRIAFVSTRDGNAEIYTMNLDGGDLLRLTTNTITDTAPVWSPDGAQLAFVSWRSGNAEIYKMAANGADPQRLTNDQAADLDPTWAPNGQRLAWVRMSGNQRRLWLMNSDGSNAYALTGSLPRLQHPTWSPNGNHLAFDYDADNDGFQELGLVDENGNNLQSILLNEPSGIAYDTRLGGWTPVGQELIYTLSEYSWEYVNGPNRPPVAFFQRSSFGSYPLVEDAHTGFFWRGNQPSALIFAPHVRSDDLQPPISQVAPLPAYSRVGNLTIRWPGIDQGPAGVANYDVQVRINNNPNWQDWRQHVEHTVENYTLPPSPNTTVRTLAFRSRARDLADNEEAWPSTTQGDSFTTLFTTEIDGHLTDARGIPRTQVELPVTPAALNTVTTDNEGVYRLRLPEAGTYQVNETPLTTAGDQSHPFYLKPAQNWLQHGDFEGENALQNWQVSGALPPALTQTTRQSGNQAVQLGLPCSGWCLTPQPDEALPANGDQRKLVIDRKDRLHLLWRQLASSGMPQGYMYRQRNEAGVWSADEPVTNESLFVQELIVAPDDSVYILWQSGFDATANIHISKRSLQGGWSTPILITAGNRPHGLVDQQGQFHLLYRHCTTSNCLQQTLFYRTSGTGAAWSPEIVMADDVGENYQISARSIQQLYIVWVSSSYDYRTPIALYGATLQDGKMLGDSILLQTESVIGGARMFSSTDGTLHLFLSSGSGFLYRQLPVDGEWTTPIQVAQTRGLTAIDAKNILHFFEPPASIGGQGMYRFKVPNQPWSTPQVVTPPLSSVIELAAGTANTLYMLDLAGQFAATTLTTEAAESRLAQSLTIPVGSHQPTLSFMYTLQGSASTDPFFAVNVQDVFTTTQLLSTTQSTPWTLVWADMSPWQGQTITVTFRVQQTPGATPVQLYLDDIALGPWTTPVPQVVIPRIVEAGVSSTLVITGQNFMATPTLRLGQTLLTDVQWLDEHTLQATLPASLVPGIYHLEVSNPGNNVTIDPSPILVGKQLYLPFIAR